MDTYLDKNKKQIDRNEHDNRYKTKKYIYYT